MTLRVRHSVCRAIVVLLMCIQAPGFVASEQNAAALCDSSAAFASQETGVPFHVLRAISLTETGRSKNGTVRPWPWTVNMEGAGKWFDDQASALSYVKRNMARGAVSFDVGCFQINYKWHGEAFASVDVMFDPDANALYAAQFLKSLYAEFGDWTRAAGAYHSRTPKYAKRYTARFMRFLASLDRVTDLSVAEHVPQLVNPPEENREAARENFFPLLVSSTQDRATASLVPLQSAPRRRLIDVAHQ